MSVRPVARAPGFLLLVALLYVLAGELLQGWIGLHLDAWVQRPAFGNARDRLEWQRVDSGLAVAARAWPWKTSLYADIANHRLHGVRGGFLSAADGGEAVLAAVDSAMARGVAGDNIIVLEIRGHLLVEDYVALRDAIDRLRRVAPHARPWWQPLVRLLAGRAARDERLLPLANDVRAYYESWAFSRAVSCAGCPAPAAARAGPASAGPAMPAR